MRYSSVTLLQYCNENKIQLTNEYTAENINRETYIEGKCITENCINKFNKCFRQLIKTGAYCDPCMQSISKNKIRNSKVKYDIHMLIDFCDTNNIILLDDYSEQFINRANLLRYGVPHHSQNAEVAETMLKCAYNKKQYKLPSGKLLDYQGYENFALDRLLRVEKIHEDNIITNRKDVPVIWYTDINNKKRRHYVDIFIPSQNRCIEVKSTWTNQTKNNVLEKQKQGKDLGYIYEVWIFDREGELINEFM